MIEDAIKSDVAPVIPGEILSLIDCPQVIKNTLKVNY